MHPVMCFFPKQPMVNLNKAIFEITQNSSTKWAKSLNIATVDRMSDRQAVEVDTGA